MSIKTRTLALAIVLASPALAHADSYDDICGGSTAPTGQKASYCASAKQAQSASKKEKTLTMIYAAVAGTCAASCMAVITADYVCEGAALGASAADFFITKNFMSVLMTGATSALGMLDTVKEGNGATSEVAGKKFRTSCFTAASAAFSTFMHSRSKSADDNTAQSNLASAKSVNEMAQNSYNLGSGDLTSSLSSGTGLATTASTATTLKPTADGSASPGDACGNTSSVSGAASCAATADPKIAGLVSSEDFQKAFQKSSGMSLGDFLKNGGNLSPSNAIQASAGAAMGDTGSVQLGKAIAALEKDMPNFNAEASASYAAGGGHKGGSDNSDLANMMNGLMGKLAPKTEEEKKNGVHEVKFSGPVRNLASVTAEDPTISLFERVAYRYSHVAPRLLSDPSKRTLSDWQK